MTHTYKGAMILLATKSDAEKSAAAKLIVSEFGQKKWLGLIFK